MRPIPIRTGFLLPLPEMIAKCFPLAYWRMLPINLSYIGSTQYHLTARRLQQRRELFVLGNVYLSLFGTGLPFAGLVMIEYRGFYHIALGDHLVLMGCSLLGVDQGARFPHVNVGSFNGLVLFGVGLTLPWVSFSLLPVPVVVQQLLAAAACKRLSRPLAVLTMTKANAWATQFYIILASWLLGCKTSKLLTGIIREENHQFGSIALNPGRTVLSHHRGRLVYGLTPANSTAAIVDCPGDAAPKRNSQGFHSSKDEKHWEF